MQIKSTNPANAAMAQSLRDSIAATGVQESICDSFPDDSLVVVYDNCGHPTLDTYEAVEEFIVECLLHLADHVEEVMGTGI